MVKDTKAFEFIYVDLKAVALGEKQRIVVSFKNHQNAQTAVLWYQKAGGDLVSVETSKVKDGAALFELNFTSAAAVGMYDLVKVSWGNTEDMEAFINDDVEGGYSFSVVEATEASSGEESGVTVYAVGENGKLTEAREVASNVNESVVGDNLANKKGSTSSEGSSELGGTLEGEEQVASAIAYSAAATAAPKKPSSDSQMVIMLDPGHGGFDPGACNDKAKLQEKTLNLKIAKYCKAELDKYPNVKTYMTRSTDVFVELADRPAKAAKVGADLFVSFHINSAPGASGFEVWIQNDSSWRYSLHAEGKQLGNAILKKLSALGIKSRGVQESDASKTKYPNGSKADYLSVLRGSRNRNIPAVLIEHGFINGSAKDVKLLKSESSLKKMGIADAQAIIDTYSLEGTLVKDVEGVRYQYADGTYAKGWKTVGKKKYYFQSDGYAATGEKTISKKRYYFDGSGVMKTGWKTFANGKSYFDKKTGAAKVGWQTISKKKYYFNKSNFRAITGEKTISKKHYYFDKSGVMKTGWKTFSNGKSYFDKKTGAAKTGWQTISKKRYYFNKSTFRAITGEKTIGKKHYYFNGSGILQKCGWKTFSNGKSYFDKKTGAAKTGWQTISKKKYYFDGKTFRAATGEKTISKKHYYFNKSGVLQKPGWVKFAHGKSYFDKKTGVAKTGWQTISKKKYYFDKKTFRAVTGEKTISKKRYYFNGSGVLQKCGWKTFADGKSYFDKKTGAAKTGWQTISKKKYYFNGKTFRAVTGEVVIGGKTYYFTSSGTLKEGSIMGNTSTSVAQMVRHYSKTVGAETYPASVYGEKGVADITAFCKLIYSEAKAEGVKPEILYSQVMLETDYLRFGNDVDVTQCNFGGFGATGNGAKGVTFDDVQTGLRAQVQHLKAYASTASLTKTCVDPRFTYVKRGSAPTAYDLSGKWAADSAYGVSIVKIRDSLLKA